MMRLLLSSRVILVLLLFGMHRLAQAQSRVDLSYATISYQTGGTADRDVRFRVSEAGGTGTLTPTIGTSLNGGLLDFGDGTAPVPVSLIATVVGGNGFYGEATITHTYATAGNYTATVTNCCRQFVGNYNGQTIKVTTLVMAGSANDSPVATAVPLYDLAYTQPLSYRLPAADPDGDPLTYSLATAEDVGNSSFVNAPATTVDPSTGIISVGNSIFEGISTTVSPTYNVVIKVSDGKTSVLVDHNIRVMARATQQAVFIAPTPADGQVFTVAPGQLVSFTVQATYRTPAFVSLSAAYGLPPGAQLSPAQPRGNVGPVQTTFTWTPTAADIGTRVINFAAYSEGTTSTAVVIQVVGAGTPPVRDPTNTPPVFAAPTPDPSQEILGGVGQPVTFAVRATDSDAGDVVTLTGLGVPTGAVLAPALPTSGNPVQTTFTWTPTVRDIGVTRVSFQAQDSRGAQSLITFRIRALPEPICDPTTTAPVARPDQFTASCGPLTITRAQLLANDTDPQGRPLQISAVNGSGNATVISNSDGTISFIPTPGFVGTTTFTYLLQLAGAVQASPATGHYYEFVPAPGICWNAAKAAAAARTYQGITGYLATVTSEDEAQHIRIRSRAAGTGSYWLGASDAAVEGEWRWQTGPEAGQQFWQGGNKAIFGVPATGAPVADRYNDWQPGEPNDYKNQFRPAGEDYASLYAGSGLWNDLDECGTGSSIAGYVVEYGGLEACTPVLFATGVVSVNVTTSPPVGGATIVNTTSGTPVVITPAQLLTGASDRQGRPLQVASVGTPTSGTLTTNANGTYTYTPAPGFVGDLTIPYVVQVAGPALASATGHYYEFVSAPNTCWSAARAAAAARTFEGMPGYLATVTSAAEADFLKGRAVGSYWFGATDDSEEGKWRWKTGPEAGQQFWEGAANGTALAYSNWSPGEPNDYKNEFRPGGEDYGMLYGGSGLWNDLDECGPGSSIAGYVVEYGGMGDCMPVLYTTIPIFVHITAPKATSQSVVALASAPASGKSAASDALLEATPNPSKGQFRVRVTAGADGPARLDLFDMQGRRVQAIFEGALQAGAPRELPVDVPGLATGLYIVRLQSGQRMQHLRVMIQ